MEYDTTWKCVGDMAKGVGTRVKEKEKNVDIERTLSLFFIGQQFGQGLSDEPLNPVRSRNSRHKCVA